MEYLLDQVRAGVCYHTHSREKVAVSELPLLDVTCVDTVIEHHNRLLSLILEVSPLGEFEILKTDPVQP
jgi:hypothetical protein